MSLPDPIQIIIITSGTEFNAVVNTTTPQFTASVGSVPLFARNAQTAVTASYALTSAGTVINATSASYISGSGVFNGIFLGSIESSSYSDIAQSISASGVVPGTFESGTYIFPADVTVSGTLRIMSSTLIVGDDIGGDSSIRVSGTVQAMMISASYIIVDQGTVSDLIAATASYIATASYVLLAETSSYVESASYAHTDWNNINNIPVGIISGSSQVNYTQISDISVGIISSSIQFPTGIVSGAAQLPSGLISSSIQLPIGIISGTAQPPTGLISGAAQLPTGIVSGAAQINSGTFTGSFLGNVTGTLLGSASFAPTEWSAISNIPSGLVSASVITNTGSFSGSLTGSLQGNATTATSASYSPTDWGAINNRPVGIISSSTQVIADLPTGTISASIQVSYPNISNIPAGIISQSSAVTLSNTTISGSLLVSGNINTSGYFVSASGFSGSGTNIAGIISSSYATTASFALNGGGGPSISSSYATTSSYASIAQNVLGSITSASYAGTDWNAINNRPIGIISGAAQVIAELPIGVVSSSIQTIAELVGSGITSQSSVNNFASTTISGTLLVSGNTNMAPYFISASAFSGSGANIVGIISASFATTSSAATSITFLPASSSYSVSSSAATSITFLPTSASYAGTDWNAINNKPVGIHSSSAQVVSSLPIGSVSSSTQVIADLIGSGITSQSSVNNFGTTTISGSLLVSGNQNNTGYFISASGFSGSGVNITGVVTASYASLAQNVLGSITSASFATTASAATSITFLPASSSYAGTDWNAINNKPVVISQSVAQTNVASLTISGTLLVSGNTNHAGFFVSASGFSGSGANIVGVVSSSYAISAGRATSITFLPTSASFAGTSWNVINNIPIGLVSASAQYNTGSYTGSFSGSPTGTFTGSLLGTSSFAISASYAPGSPSVSASYELTSSFSNFAIDARHVRLTYSVSSSNLAPSQKESGSLALGTAFVLFIVSSSTDTRLRLYSTVANRNADFNRSMLVDPSSSVCLSEIICTGSVKVITLAPTVYGYNGEIITTGSIPYTIDNISAASASTTMSLIYTSM